ncbi:nucleotidyl transferase AbiEii/AbiGii toxin family protein [Agrobacterium sp. SOY23]|uniref:nucleotidyl transferase AbiEii/AbiGii toxin family protein n=1 Tax=Agrobacterium sp. SOY23 TaxID=3014555 RepID=UPI0022AED1B0|nr:nucleotidyl transferase AbiEii/AbiGii toxin family protein [Agrobacterium sp. SOY23]MCZ4432085.1 nucleotidyl transferase AbiEii/AbiGii toxin family protein [Agrobacterium sp. SOY23]
MPAPQTILINAALSTWVDEARADPVTFQERQVTEILLQAIGITQALRQSLILKGGILMSLMHGSYRHTGDVDFTAIVDPEPYAEQLKTTLGGALRRAAAELGYADLVCAVQRFDYQPRKDGFSGFTAPALKLSIGHARKGTTDEQRLAQGRSTRIVEVDISFKETVVNTAEIVIEEPGVTILTYSVEEIIAEKIRAILQQVKRNRTRRQDVFDIVWLLDRYQPGDEMKIVIHATLLKKSQARDLDPGPGSFDDPEVKRRSAEEWETMRLEVGNKLPDFETAFSRVGDFYRTLPWGS